MKYLWVCLLLGCHAQQHAENIGRSSGHVVDLEKCINEAVATYQTTGDPHKANAEYVACADAADEKWKH